MKWPSSKRTMTWFEQTRDMSKYAGGEGHAPGSRPSIVQQDLCLLHPDCPHTSHSNYVLLEGMRDPLLAGEKVSCLLHKF